MHSDMSATGTSPETCPAPSTSMTWKESCGLTASICATASVCSNWATSSSIGASVSTSP